jgi:hypothetical protein
MAVLDLDRTQYLHAWWKEIESKSVSESETFKKNLCLHLVCAKQLKINQDPSISAHHHHHLFGAGTFDCDCKKSTKKSSFTGSKFLISSPLLPLMNVMT